MVQNLKNPFGNGSLGCLEESKMDEIITLLAEIRDLLVEVNTKLDDIKGDGIYTSISDVCDKIDAISVSGMCSIGDVCSRIDDLQGPGIYNTIGDVCTKLDTLDSTIMLKD